METKTWTTCPFCGVGCGIVVHTREGRIRWVDDDPANLSSRGMLCVKGRFGTTFVQHPDRLTTPLIRRGGEFVPATWDEALDLIAERLPAFRGRFGSFASAKATNEDAFVQQKFIRLIMGTNNIDHCTRLCHSPSVEAMLDQLGSGATSNSYSDYEEASCLVLVGCDPGSNHPVIASRMRKAVDEFGTRLVVVNPKRIDMAERADIFLQPLPGTDVALFNGMARAILDEGLEDRAFIAGRTEGFEAWRAAVLERTVEEYAAVCGVGVADLREAARLYAAPPPRRGLPPGERPGSCLAWGMGITQHAHGTDNARALINLALLTGQLGRPGCGISPLRGQNNVQGCGDAGCIPDSLPGYQPYAGDVAAIFEEAWGAGIPREPGIKATDMVERIEAGDIRAMYIVGENPLLSEPNLAHAGALFRQLDFLVVQDLFLHETAQLADVVLPACSFAEKDGTFTNSERRVQRVRPAIPPVGASRPDWAIIADLARRMAPGAGIDPRQFAYGSAAEVFAEMARLTPQLRGISYERLDREGGIQWPCPNPDHPGTRFLYADRFPRGLGKFVPVRQAAPAAELPDSAYPLVLNTGRVLYHWHGGTITRRVQALVEQMPEVPVAIHPDDAARLGIDEGVEVVVRSRRGRLTGKAVITDAVREGSVFVPFVKLQESAANFLTNNAYDEPSRIPEYKVCAVRVEKKRPRPVGAIGAPPTASRGR
ncbi:formate dehydrogenase subunit alpha [Tepidiforma sp.]|uniref:formate dehydrogenase subunit alpha n=1 Tax=Tepidiforma sp. TaxID=2682230 RepID=UPI00262AE8B7|nr:formate dehydrogenase subunit alpha [Tepidiforma sp.]MCX7616851.1 formate dehydrogenase subunit alpha [Tepidiforma sp.]